MRLTEDERLMLMQMGYPAEDFPQIREAALAKNTVYKLNGKKRITADDVVRMIGLHEYLSALARSAFHWNTTRDLPNGGYIEFDSSRMFKS